MDKKEEAVQLNEEQDKRKDVLLLVSLGIAVVLGISSIHYFKSLAVSKQTLADTTTIPDEQPSGSALAPQTPAPLRDIQKQQLAAGTSTATTKKLFEVTGGNYYFTPATMTVVYAIRDEGHLPLRNPTREMGLPVRR